MKFKIAGRMECSDHFFSNLTRNKFVLYFSTKKWNEKEKLFFVNCDFFSEW